jgi:UDP-N-acetylglucosamine 2-epimerase (non-hydrolysing)
MHKIGVAVGTRPEAIKISPLVIEFKKQGIQCDIVMSGQHVGLVYDVLQTFQLNPKVNLSIENKGSEVGDYFSELMKAFTKHLNENTYDLFLVHGDTLTAAAAALACYFKKVKVGHIEAGLRTKNIFNPFPEEGNREIIDIVSSFKFAPTKLAYSNLQNQDLTIITGNTGMDAVRAMYDLYLESRTDVGEFLSNKFSLSNRSYLLVTLHRRESFGAYHKTILETLTKLSKKVEIVFILHPNPNIKNLAISEFENNSRIKLLEPQNYFEFFHLMLGALAIVTDSGGIQEEAFSLGIPLLVTRESTERPEILSSSLNHIVGRSEESLIHFVEILLADRDDSERKFRITELGDGKASSRIVDYISKELSHSRFNASSK